MSKQSAYYRVYGLTARDSHQIKRTLDGIPGVLSVSVSTDTRKVAVDYDSTGTNAEDIRSCLADSGYEAQLLADCDHTM